MGFLKIKLKVILLSMASLSKQPIEKIREVNFDFSENRAQLKFELNENIAQPIENIRELKNQFSENKAQPNFGLNENINQPNFGLVKTDIRSETCVEFFC